MQEHYQLSDSQWIYLQSQGVTIEDLFYGVEKFHAENAPVSKVSLMHYADFCGDFTEGERKLDLVAQQVFYNLSIPDKVEIGEYLNWLEGR